MAQININDISLTSPSSRTISERQKFAGLLDDFATFTWNNINMFNEFGAFIINEKKGSLKMYNGPSFKNNYSQQQFQDGYSNLTGVTFNTQQISFTVGVYWISIEDYRVLMNVLHPYEVAMLSFSFEKEYGYQCKLSNIKDSTRHIVGKETDTSNASNTSTHYSRLEGSDASGYRYYTELQLTFDVVGKQCAKEITENRIVTDPEVHFSESYTINKDEDPSVWPWPSDLNYPITIDFKTMTSSTTATDAASIAAAKTPELQAFAYFKPKSDSGDADPNTWTKLQLFHVKFRNIQPDTILTFRYDSEQGLIYIKLGDKEQILTLLSIGSDGKRLVEYLEVNRFYWPGRLEKSEVNTDNLCKIVIKDITKKESTDFPTISINSIEYASRRRTNVI